MDKCREEFEAHFKNTLFYANMLISLKQSGIDTEPFELRNGQYRNAYVQLAYSTWSVQQAKVEELTRKLSAALGDLNVANKNLRDRFSAFQMVRQEADGLQKRVDAALEEIENYHKLGIEDRFEISTAMDAINQVKQAIKGKVNESN